VEEPALLMEMEPEDRNSGMEEPEIWNELSDIVRKEYGQDKKIGKISRQKYYDISKEAYLIIQTGEERLYGDIILVKGVVK
jgi:L-fucose mutarotase